MPNVYALLVGVNCYAAGDSTPPPLRGCVNDVTAMQSALTRLIGVPEQNICLLTEQQATRDAIIDGWRRHLRDRVQPGDVAYFHYSGHGSQACSTDPSEADGFDETLVAYDSRLAGHFDLLDKELAALIDEVEQRQAQVIVFLDCCHSGGGTRAEAVAAVRKCPTDMRQRPVETVLAAVHPVGAKTRSASGWKIDGRHLLLAACRDEEKANEYFADGIKRWHGAATYFFLQALLSYRASMTWADACDQIYANVHAIYTNQSPQLEGPGNLSLFGGAGNDVGSYLLVTATRKGQIKLSGGLAMGVTLGCKLAIYPPSSTLEHDPLALALVEEADVDSAWARLDRAVDIAIASRARIIAFGYGAQVLPVAVADLTARNAISQSANGSPSRFLEVVESDPQQDGEQGAALIVWVENGCYVVRDPAGEQIVNETPPVGPDGAARIVRSLEHLAIFRNVRSLHNNALDPALSGAVQVTEPMIVKPSRSNVTAAGALQPLRQQGQELVASPGQTISFDVVNRSQSRLFVTVLRLGADFSIKRIEPLEGRQTTLPPAGKLTIRQKLAPATSGQSHSVLILKIFITSEKVSFDSLELPALNEGPIHTNDKVRDAGPLSSLLDAVRRTGTRPIRPLTEDSADDKWIVEQVEVTIRERIEN
jgi:hypothetical protein